MSDRYVPIHKSWLIYIGSRLNTKAEIYESIVLTKFDTKHLEPYQDISRFIGDVYGFAFNIALVVI